MKEIRVWIYVNPDDEKVRNGAVKHTNEGYFQIIVSREEKIEIIKNKPIDYKSLITQGKVLKIKKIHIADVVISEKGIEGLANVNSQKHSVKLLEILQTLQNKDKIGVMGPSKSGLGLAYTEVDSSSELYAWGVHDYLIEESYMVEMQY